LPLLKFQPSYFL